MVNLRINGHVKDTLCRLNTYINTLLYLYYIDYTLPNMIIIIYQIITVITNNQAQYPLKVNLRMFLFP